MRCALAFVGAVLSVKSALLAQTAAPPPASATAKPTPKVKHEANFDAEREQANQLYLAQKPLEALPLYEDLSRQDPTVAVFAERHGAGLLTKSTTVTDPKEKQVLIGEGMKELQRAESLGDNSPYVETMLSALSKSPIGLIVSGPLGGLPLTVGYTYHGSEKTRPIFQQAETAYQQGDLQQALKLYLAVVAADPSWYEPTIDAGDVYFRMKDYKNAATWYGKAAAIDPDRETAFRHWGDALVRNGDTAGARAKYEQAIVAEPYTRSSRAGLQQWAVQTHTSLVAPQVVRPEFTTPDGKLAVDPALTEEKGDGHASWLIYQQHRVAHGARTASQAIMAGSTPATAEFSFAPSGYVHTLAEEMDAIEAMLLDVNAKLTAGTVTREKLEPNLKTLLQLQKDNMLEPFIFLNFNDAGIRHGYPEYRVAHRDQVAAYVDRYWIGPSVPQGTPSP